jgi:hypothetical protein
VQSAITDDTFFIQLVRPISFFQPSLPVTSYSLNEKHISTAIRFLFFSSNGIYIALITDGRNNNTKYLSCKDFFGFNTHFIRLHFKFNIQAFVRH